MSHPHCGSPTLLYAITGIRDYSLIQLPNICQIALRCFFHPYHGYLMDRFQLFNVHYVTIQPLPLYLCMFPCRTDYIIIKKAPITVLLLFLPFQSRLRFTLLASIFRRAFDSRYRFIIINKFSSCTCSISPISYYNTSLGIVLKGVPPN
jgi:hypothetical protein